MFIVWPTTFEKYFEFYAKLFCCFKKRGDCLQSIFWKIGFKTCVLEEHFISYSCIFISYILCFEVRFKKSSYFSKKLFFQNFNWSNLIFDQSKSCLKNSVSLCLVRLIEPVFWSIEHHVSSFFKNSTLTDSNTFSKKKKIQTFLSLSDLARLHRRFFVIFNLIFARFFSLKAGKTFIPLLLFLFSRFHALFYAF